LIVEDLDHRVWAALRPVDAMTHQPVMAAVHGEGQRWLRNNKGLWVLNGLAEPISRRADWQGYEGSFAAPVSMAPLAVRAVVTTPGERYLPRIVTLTLPLSDSGAEPPLFSTREVLLYAAPHGNLALGWAVLRISLRHTGRPAAGAVASLHENGTDTPLLARGQTDQRGEGVVAVPGLAHFVRNPAAPPAFVRERRLQLHVVWELLGGEPIDPDDLATRSGAGYVLSTTSVLLASGRSTSVTIDLP
jgi:hypothetical protein